MRLLALNKSLVENYKKIENERNELAEKVNEVDVLLQKVEELQKTNEMEKNKVDELEETKVELEQRLDGAARDAEENSQATYQEINKISEDNKDLKMRLNALSSENDTLTKEKLSLEKEIEDYCRLVAEKHVTFQRIGSQSKSTQDLASEFDKMIESTENSPSFDSFQNSPFNEDVENTELLVVSDNSGLQTPVTPMSSTKKGRHSTGDSPVKNIGGGGDDAPEIAETEAPVQNDTGSTTPKRPHSPGESPNKKILILPEGGKWIWIQNKDGKKNEYLVRSRKNKNTMNLENRDGVKLTKNFKDLTWGYIEQEAGDIIQ